jgi:hypothetical protein
MDILSTSVGVLIGLIVTSIFRIAESGIRKRITVRSPESKAIQEIVPAVNMILSCLGAMLTAEEASLEALHGQCNGNIDEALEKVTKAKQKYRNYIDDQVQIGG